MQITRWFGLLGLLLSGLGCSGGPEVPPSFILVSLDTVRADRLGLYGYERDTSPHLDGILAEGLVFDDAWTVSNNTLVAHASLFTGLQPGAHGADPETPLAQSYATLAEDLRQAGYETVAFAAHRDWISASFGLDRGFEIFESDYRSAREVLKDAADWLRRRDPTRPFFLFLHFYDAHSDWGRRAYDAPRGVRGRFTSGYRGHLRARPDEPKKGSRYLRAAARGEVEMTPEELRFVSGQYDEGLIQLDRDLGRFLESVFPLVNTWVFVTADHGEEFREHGGLLHDQLFVETTRIPLVAIAPVEQRDEFESGKRTDALARIVDLRATLLALAGLHGAGEDQGRSLVPAFHGQDSGAEAVVAVGSKGGTSVRTDAYSFFERESKDGAPPATRIFDRVKDPTEGQDLSGRRDLQDRIAAIRNLLVRQRAEDAAIRARHVEPVPVELDSEAQERLRSLGYLD